jgi:DNA-binding winged helix-turn-helix (wHTH) protein/Flp pilus assembly protein TadD
MESKAAPIAVHFGDSAFDVEKGVLVRSGKQHYLRPKASALLKLLARNLGRVVSKQEMFDAAWPGVFVTEDSLIQAIREIRKAIGDDDQSILRNVSRRGYILVGDEPENRSGGSQPVVAFFRCANETGNASLTPIIDGFVEEVMNGLARFGTVAVLARQTSFLFNSSDQESWKLARANFGANYIVEGTARPSAKGFRITGNLVDAATLSQLASMSFEANAETIFDVQNEMAQLVISTLERRVADISVQRAYRRPIEDLEGYELLLRGVAVSRNNNEESFAESERLLRAAVAKDPASGLALAQLANVQVMKAGFGRAPRQKLDKILEAASKAVVLSPEQPVAHRVLSFIQMYRHEHGAAEHHLRRSLDLNPYDAESLEQMGYLMTLRGKPVEAMQWMDRAVKLNPIHPEWYEHDRSFALYLLGEYRKAAETIELSPLPPPWMLTWLAACYAQMGELETARQHIARVTEVDPRFSSIDFAQGNGAAFEHASDNEHFAEGVFLALGIPME